VALDGRTHAVADAKGYFKFDSEQVQGAGASIDYKVSLSVSVEGYAEWSLDGAMYYAGDTLRVYPHLQAGSDKLTDLASTSHHATTLGAGHGDMVAASLASVDAAPPSTIRIYRTASQVVEVVPFRDYLKHTLPNEWIPSWSPEALKAGAMAVKSYAWYWVARGGKQVALGADLKDNVEDQVYDPNVSYASTDAAVDATYNYALLRNGAVPQAQYCAGAYDGDPTGDCPWPGPYMTQWGSAYYADQGKTWGWIVGFYYFGSVVSPAPPGGGYNGVPPTSQPTQVAPPTHQPTPPPPVSYVVGQGSNQAEVFEEAYRRNGGEVVLGQPTGPVRWWMQYLSESNVVAQPFSGPQGRGDIWLVFNILNSSSQIAQRAFMISGDIGRAYSDHTPPGPEWVGAPTSDPYMASSSAGGLLSQGFTGGTLTWNGQSVAFVPSPTRFTDWKAEYFVGYQPTYPGQAPERDLSGTPALVTNALTPSFQWLGDMKVPQSMGVGRGAWSLQMTKEIKSTGESYDFALTANSGARLWIDGMLAINGWNWTAGGSDRYNADLVAGTHTIRVQYYSVDASKSANLDLVFALRSAATPTPKPVMPRIGKIGGGMAALRLRVTWLGRQPSSAGWVQPVTLYLSEPQSARVLYSFTGQTDRNGVAYFGDLPAGRFNVHVKGAKSLQSARANIALSDNSVVDLDMKAQIAGDLDGDNCVTVDDFSIVQSMLGASTSTPGFNPAADLNGDGVVTMSDVSLLRSGFDRCGDISADEEFRIMSEEQSPKLSDMLLPWTQPERLNHNLSLELVTSQPKVARGQVIEVQVVVNTGTQQVDGASYVISYDPKRLRPVDATGNDATGSEPGVALPAVMGNWIDTKGGLVGYSAGVLQGDTPQGRFVVATLRFRVLPGTNGNTRVSFAALPSPNMQVTNGGTNLLARAGNLDLVISP
jgi:hypothetical protein